MRLNSFYPVLLTPDVDAGSRFFVEHLGFRETFRSDWYVSLVHGGRPEYELAFVLSTHESVPAAARGTSTTVLLNLEVDDAQAEHDRLRAAGLQIVLPLRDEPWGQRHFIGAAAPGIHLDVVQVIPAAPGFAEQYLAPAAG